MSMFTLAISCLTTPNLPWFMDLTSRFLCNVVLYSFQLFFYHQSHPQLGVVFALTQPLLSGAISPFFSSSILGTYQPGEFTFSVISFCLLIVFMVFSRQEYWSGLPFPSPVGPVLSELSTMAGPSSVAPHGMAHSFIESDKAVTHVIGLVSFLWLWFSFCLSSDGWG